MVIWKKIVINVIVSNIITGIDWFYCILITIPADALAPDIIRSSEIIMLTMCDGDVLGRPEWE